MIFRQLLRFGLVGALATLVHMLIGVTLIHSGWPALGANPVSFVIAFVVSFMGHYGFSFSDQEVDIVTSLKRFSIVACGGFIANEALLAVLVWSGGVPQILALVFSTGTAAVGSFFASRNWAFQKSSKEHETRFFQ